MPPASMRTAEVRPACTAPWTSLKLDPTGRVSMCRHSEDYPLGRIRPGGESLRDIWEGPRAMALRAALSEGDHSLGCQACEPSRWLGDPAARPARDYDRFDESDDPGWPQAMDFSLSNTCNLACVMCHGDVSSRIRSQREHRPALRSPYDDGFYAQLSAFLPHLRACTFHGGEPFLGRQTRRVWSMLEELGTQPEVFTITNGTVWDDEVERQVRALRMGIVVSIDGFTATTVERVREGVDHRELLANLARFQTVTAELSRPLSLNYCLVRENAHELGDFLVWAADQGLSARVIDVVHPTGFDVATLPAEELEETVRQLDADERRLDDRLGINRGSWRRAVERLRAAVQADGRAARGTPVELGRHGPVAAGSMVTAPVRRTVSLSVGPDPLVIHVESVVVAVEAPPWASELDPAAWIGKSEAEVDDLLVGHFGVEPSVVEGVTPGGRTGWQLTFPVVPGPVTLHVIVDGAGRSRTVTLTRQGPHRHEADGLSPR